MCLCYDLIVTIKNPFKPPGTRVKLYYLISALIPILFYSVILITRKETNNDCSTCLSVTIKGQSTNATQMSLIPSGNLILAVSLSTYMLLAFLSLFYAYRRL